MANLLPMIEAREIHRAAPGSSFAVRCSLFDAFISAPSPRSRRPSSRERSGPRTRANAGRFRPDAPSVWRRGLRQLLVWFSVAGILLLGLVPARGEEARKVKPAKLKISGFGLLGNRELKKTIRLMGSKKTTPEFY